MQTGIILFAALVTFMVMKPVVRALFAFFAGKSVAKKALASIPDTIHLAPAAADSWQDPIRARRLASELAKRGFEDAGTFNAPELKGVTLELMLQPVEAIIGVVYEHPVAGQWVELVTHYADGTSYHVTSNRETGLDPRPGHKSVHLPGGAPDILHKRLISGRPEAEAERFDAHELAQVFEQMYAESVAWRKAQGISRKEVVKVATRRAA